MPEVSEDTKEGSRGPIERSDLPSSIFVRREHDVAHLLNLVDRRLNEDEPAFARTLGPMPLNQWIKAMATKKGILVDIWWVGGRSREGEEVSCLKFKVQRKDMWLRELLGDRSVSLKDVERVKKIGVKELLGTYDWVKGNVSEKDAASTPKVEVAESEEKAEDVKEEVQNG